ncbi:MAG TPA: BBE domain-containing protein [Dehalococcoidia bacterium]|nr:BBE domain-containing protein [Dehalococcoidia bacterium]
MRPRRKGSSCPWAPRPNTGIAGLTLGGGMGWLTAKLGLTVDNVLGFEVVLANGEVVRAGETAHPDLFWALRGGSGNFGVVTGFHHRLSEVGTVLGGMVVYPFAQAREVLRFYHHYTLHTTDDVTAYAGLLSTPDGQPAVAIAVCATGPTERAQRMVEAVRRFGSPLMDLIQPLSYEQMVGLLDPASPPGFNYYVKANALPWLSGASIDAIVECGAARPSPRSAVVIQHFHGAAARMPVTATAFSQRHAHFDVMHIAGWTDEEDGEPSIGWVRAGIAATQRFAEEGIYVNFLGAGESEERIRASYGPNYERLAEIKRRYDPENLFQRNPNVRPARPARPDAVAAA